MARLQLIVREAVPDRKTDFSSPDWQAEARRPVPKSSICFLFLQVEKGVVGDESFYGTHHSERNGRLSFDIGSTPQPMDDRWQDEAAYRYGHVDTSLTSMTVKSEGFDNLLGVGKVLLRRSSMPVPDGMEGFVGAGILLRTNGIPDGTLFSFEGDAIHRLKEISRKHVDDAFPIGGVPRNILDRPIWGFGKEPRSFGATLPLDVATVLDRWKDLEAMSERTSEEDAEFEALATDPAVVDFYSTRRDTDYADFLDFYRAMPEYGNRIRLLDCPTAEEIDVAHEGFQQAFEQWSQAGIDGPKRRFSF